MIAIAVPPGTSDTVLAFLRGWSLCMAAMPYMTSADKHQVENIFKENIEPTAQCQELKELDAALMKYLLHKCNAPEGIGSAAAKGTA